ncbi:MAG: ABC transporter substrate-binding protein [Alphaproteobacteria bacterium]|nr:ABC transporter substrate-binding protein [Alphaproteobacteria bacterium]
MLSLAGLSVSFLAFSFLPASPSYPPAPVYPQAVIKAQAAAPAAASAESTRTPAGKFVQNLGDEGIAILSGTDKTPAQRNEQYHRILRDSFDLKTMGRFVMGRTWNAATNEQKEEYLKLFEKLVVKIYGDRLALYKGEKFDVKAARPEGGDIFIVSSEVMHPGGETPTKIDWRVHEKEGKFLVTDVIIGGVSQVVTQRSEYAAIIQREGVPGLLARMKQRLQEPQPSQTQ